VSDDPLRTYTLIEEERLARQLLAVVTEIQQGNWLEFPSDIRLLCRIHRFLFEGVRNHAGRIRAPGSGSEYLQFGPNRSMRHTEVSKNLEKVFTKTQHAVSSFDDNKDDQNYDSKALRLAVWVHAQIVRIHPFEDGNGRSSRCFMNWILIRLGLHPIAMEVVRAEYNNCLNHYFDSNDLEPLFDLCLRLYTDSQP
jgi:fido (protein-threonine AMPylation protein)